MSTVLDEIKIVCKAKEGVILPSQGTLGSAGADVRAYISQDIVIGSGCRSLIPTGLFLQIPYGYEIQVRPRSGLALNYGVTVLNSPGTIDSDYRGEIGIILINHGDTDFIVKPGMRIAQLVLGTVSKVNFVLEQDFEDVTERGTGGFGHTGED